MDQDDVIGNAGQVLCQVGGEEDGFFPILNKLKQ